MPWKQTTPMEQKIEFICEWRSGKYTITEWCNAFEISRPTAYKLISRFEEMGFDGKTPVQINQNCQQII